MVNPLATILGARRARRDEVRHHDVISTLAGAQGVRAPAVNVVNSPPRMLEEFAVENMVEGCVRETFGALIATWQAVTSRDPVFRRLMWSIAVDETRHAALSWQTARWTWERLRFAGRSRIVVAWA